MCGAKSVGDVFIYPGFLSASFNYLLAIVEEVKGEEITITSTFFVRILTDTIILTLTAQKAKNSLNPS